MHIVYLHGFLSSPQSQKAQQTRAYASKYFPSYNFHAPTLLGDIHRTVNIVDALVSTLPKGQIRFIGSSMGGYLSSYCVEKYGGKAVLVNPAVEPYNLLQDYQGSHVNPYTGERFTVHTRHLRKLALIDTKVINEPTNYMVLLQTNDEVLDYQLAARKYNNAKLIIEEGGDHSFIGYEHHLPEIFRFLQ